MKSLARHDVYLTSAASDEVCEGCPGAVVGAGVKGVGPGLLTVEVAKEMDSRAKTAVGTDAVRISSQTQSMCVIHNLKCKDESGKR